MTRDAYADACDRAEYETEKARRLYANEILVDSQKCIELLHRRMAEVSPEADALCLTVARLLVFEESPASLLAALAAEEAKDEVRTQDPEDYMEDEQ